MKRFSHGAVRALGLTASSASGLRLEFGEPAQRAQPHWTPNRIRPRLTKKTRAARSGGLRMGRRGMSNWTVPPLVRSMGLLGRGNRRTGRRPPLIPLPLHEFKLAVQACDGGVEDYSAFDREER